MVLKEISEKLLISIKKKEKTALRSARACLKNAIAKYHPSKKIPINSTNRTISILKIRRKKSKKSTVSSNRIILTVLFAPTADYPQLTLEIDRTTMNCENS